MASNPLFCHESSLTALVIPLTGCWYSSYLVNGEGGMGQEGVDRGFFHHSLEWVILGPKLIPKFPSQCWFSVVGIETDFL